jgi:predicted nucleic acid-binding protein
MIPMILTLIVDTYAWIDYFEGNPSYKEIIEKNTLITPTLVVAEIVRTMLRKGYPSKLIEKQLEIVKGMSLLVDLDYEHAKRGGELAQTHNLHFSDALIYSFADKEHLLLTGDKHFEGKPNVKFVK